MHRGSVGECGFHAVVVERWCDADVRVVIGRAGESGLQRMRGRRR
jgi:hypothetical protein